MDKAPEYRLIPEIDTDTNENCPVEILNGEFAGIIYRYGKISLKEENDNLHITMDIDIIKCPEEFNSSSPEFTNTAGEIFSKILEDNIGEFEPVDLEDDVHQD